MYAPRPADRGAGHSVAAVGAYTVILLAGMQGIPEELYESAMIDPRIGASQVSPHHIASAVAHHLFLLVVDLLAAFQAFTQFHVLTKRWPD